MTSRQVSALALSLVLGLSSPAMGQDPGHRPAPSLEDLEIADQMEASIDEDCGRTTASAIRGALTIT